MSTSSNSTFYDPMPFECDLSYDPVVEFIKYVIQCIYLFFGAVLIAYMLYVMLIKHSASYFKNNSYYQIFIFDLITGLYMTIHDMVFGRVTVYITPLCPLLGPYFYNYSILQKVSYISVAYVRASKTVCQIFLTFNRLTCVISPVFHSKYWGKYMSLVNIANVILPFGAIWMLFISRVYTTYDSGGFSITYMRAIQWASLSRFQSIYLTISLIISTFNSLATIYGLQALSHRVKNVERTLCFATFFITTGIIFVASFQYIWVFCSYCVANWNGVYNLQPVSYDILNIGTPIMMLLANEKLRSDMFPRYSKDKVAAASRSVTIIHLS